MTRQPSKRSRTSGQQSAAEKATWARRRGHPGGARSEAEKQGLDVQAAPASGPTIDRAMLRAFLAGDQEYLARVLNLEPWEDSPLVDRPGECTQGHPIATPMPGWGCHDQHAAYALRQRILAKIERDG
jgi:hypothetical protein